MNVSGFGFGFGIEKVLIKLLRIGRQSAVPPQTRIRLLTVAALILVAISLGFYLQLLLQRPTRTPLIMLTVAYESPWQPNARVANCKQLLNTLQKRNLTIFDIEETDELARGQWSEWEDTVARAVAPIGSDTPLLLYINMHGAVNAHSEPRFLLANSNVLDESTWLSLPDLLQHVQHAAGKDRAIVLFLESSHRSNLLPKNATVSFTQSLQMLLESSHEWLPENIALVATHVNAFSDEPFAVGSPETFTAILWKGLQGLCDAQSPSGNSNRVVEWNELVSYLKAESSKGSTGDSHERSEDLFVAVRGKTPTAIAWTTNRKFVSHTADDVVDTDHLARIVAVWKRWHALNVPQLWRVAAPELSRARLSIVASEEYAFSGVANHAKSRSSIAEAEHWLNAADAKLNESDATEQRLLVYRLSEQSKLVWQELMSVPLIATADTCVERWTRSHTNDQPLPVPFIYQCLQNRDLILWQDSRRLKLLAEFEHLLETLRETAFQLPFTHYLAERSADIENRRRWLEDAVLCNRIDATWDKQFEQSSLQLQSLEQLLSEVRDALNGQYTAYGHLPTFLAVMDILESNPTSSPSIFEKLQHEMVVLTEDLNANFNELMAMAEGKKTREGFVDLAASVTSVRKDLAAMWRSALNSTTAADHRVLHGLLASGILPTEIGSVDQAVEMRLATRKHLAQKSEANSIPKESSANSSTNKLAQSPTAGSTGRLPSHRYEREFAPLLDRWLTLANRSDSENTYSQSGADSIEMAQVPTSSAEPRRRVNSSIASSRDLYSRLRNFVDSPEAMSPGENPKANIPADAICRVLLACGADHEWDELLNDLMETDRHLQLLAQCNRVLDDFWRGISSDDVSYFADVTSRTIEWLEANGQHNTLPSELVRGLKSKLLQRKEAAESALKLESLSLPQLRSTIEQSVECRVLPGTNIAGLPGGYGYVALESAQRGTLVSDRQPVQLGASFIKEECKLIAANRLATPASQLTSANAYDRNPVIAERLSTVAVVRFRGHRFAAPFDTQAVATAVTIGKKSDGGPASLLIEDNRPRSIPRVLVLDCSASMNEQSTVEGITGPAPTTKLQLAKQAVASILQQVTNGSDPIGVIFYGHRVAVGNAEQGVLFQNRYQNRFPFPLNLAAYEDVETVLPVGRFGTVELSQVKDRLDLLLPWGQTPLYLAIDQAIRDIERYSPMTADTNYRGDVIVVSDGRNYQFNASVDKRLELEQVVASARRTGIRIHVIGFGVPKNEAEEASQQYLALASQSGGTAALQVADSLKLIENLQTIVRPRVFTVQLPKGERLEGVCGRPFVFDQRLSENTPIHIYFQEHHQLVPISPRSAIRFSVGANDQLTSARFKSLGTPVIASVTTTNRTQSPFQVNIHPPRFNQSAVRWLISLERSDGAVAQRPKYVWLEIQPGNYGDKGVSKESQSKYILADGLWLEDAPVPVLQLDTQDWPPSMTTAQVQFWCTDRPPTPLAQAQLSDLVPGQIADSGPQIDNHWSTALKNLGVQCRLQRNADGFTLAMLFESERFSAGDIVPLITGLPEGTRIERSFLDAQKMSMHEFKFPRSISDSDLHSLIIELYSVTSFKKVALHASTDIALPKR